MMGRWENQEGFLKAEVKRVSKDSEPDPAVGGDKFAHAAGAICKNCDAVIEPGQAARRRGETEWAHDVCPLVTD